MKDEITKRQRQVLEAIYNSLRESGYPPSLSDLRDVLGISSNQAILDLLKILESKKIIKRVGGVTRGITILKKGFSILDVTPILPCVGVSAAGPYTQAFENVQWRAVGDIEEMEDIMVKIRGNSMIDVGIQDGDVVVVRKTSEFRNGDIVLARSNDGTTVKRFVSDNGRVYLKPENTDPKYKNIPIYPDTRLVGKIVRIVGKN